MSDIRTHGFRSGVHGFHAFMIKHFGGHLVGRPRFVECRCFRSSQNATMDASQRDAAVAVADPTGDWVVPTLTPGALDTVWPASRILQTCKE